MTRMKFSPLLPLLRRSQTRLSARTFCTDRALMDTSRIRNIGIMAHIDAGKTTTTERMLYYSGYISKLGEVHTGDTVMDYMDQERDRGITITAAAITLPWHKHQINLIDTPGHVDFTMEVERSLRVTDGAILILDGSAGVQAQTLTVWRQAIRNCVNRIAFINKLDKPGGNVEKTLQSMKKRLNVTPLLTHMLLGQGKELYGLVDLVDMSGFVWNKNSQGKQFHKLDQNMLKNTMYEAWEDACKLRAELVENCCDFDNEIAEAVILAETYDKIEGTQLRAALRRITINPDSNALVTCLGSAYKNIGVQPLMDAVVQYLPSPEDKIFPFLRYYGSGFCGLVFKIIHHPQKGVLSFVRVYSGELTSNSSVYNVNKEQTEKFGRLLVAFADDFREVDKISAGNIAVIAGLKLTVTGDTIVESSTTAKAAVKAVAEETGYAAQESASAVLAAPFVPEPVFFCSVEPPSMSAQKQFDLALDCLSREDPSLRVKVDEETGQTVLGGMGELHLEIVVDRMRTVWKVDADVGKLQVAYREVPCTQTSCHEKFERRLGDKVHLLQLALAILPAPGRGSAVIKWSTDREAQDSFLNLKPQMKKTLEAGIKTGLSSGPLLGYPVVDCEVIISNVQIGRGTSLPMISAGTTYITKKLIKETELRLAEPFMDVEIVCEDDVTDTVLQDLRRRRGEVDYRKERGGEGLGLSQVQGQVPLAELRGYSTALRTVTSGKANLSMELSHYQLMSEFEQDKAIEEVTGFSPH